MQLMKNLLYKMTENGSSDLHVYEGEPPIFRIDGDLRRDVDEPIFDKESIKEVIKFFLNDEEEKELYEKGEVDLAYELEEISRYRVNIYKQKGKISAAIRKVPIIVKSFEELYLPKVLERLARKEKGLILVTGPTGSGKSTTLAAILNYINKNLSRHIVTLEHPIEMVHENKKKR